MERIIKGDIVVIPFPFSDLSSSKRRPALVLAVLKGNDFILCQITSKFRNDEYAIELSDSDFTYGSLNQISNIRPNRIFTADASLILKTVGHLKEEKQVQTVNKIIELIS
jgi:mRNA interferase MazF